MMFLRMSPIALTIGVALLASAGRVNAWTLVFYPALVWIATGTVNTALQRVQPQLLAERLKPPSDRDKKSRIVAAALLLVHCVIAGLDVRFVWSQLPAGAQVAGFALITAAFGLVGWTLASNPYASSAVRIQSERGQQVIARGPYQFVRHPMYLGVLLYAVGSPLALGSAWSALPLIPVIAVFVRRTLLEDAMLRAELPGYAEYAARVRFRVPRVF